MSDATKSLYFALLVRSLTPWSGGRNSALVGLAATAPAGTSEGFAHGPPLFPSSPAACCVPHSATSAEAGVRLALVIGNGKYKNVPALENPALDYYEKSIEAGNSFALNQIGIMYFNGKGVERNYDAAAEYFQQAADLGDGYAFKFLAILHERGLIGGKPDRERAIALRARAQEAGPEPEPRRAAGCERAPCFRRTTPPRHDRALPLFRMPRDVVLVYRLIAPLQVFRHLKVVLQRRQCLARPILQLRIVAGFRITLE
jgi:hypothetical protein